MSEQGVREPEQYEPDDNVIAALQEEVVRQRSNDNSVRYVAELARLNSAADLLADAAVLLRAYEAKVSDSGVTDGRPGVQEDQKG